MDINNQFDDEDINVKPCMEIKYCCATYYNFHYHLGHYEFTSSGFTLLMKLVLLTKRNEEAINLIRDLLNENPNIINQRNDEGFTALMLAAANSYGCSTENTVKMLIDFGADVNLQNNLGGTALGFAILDNNRGSNKTTIDMIISAGANVNLQNSKGSTVLMCAVIYRMYSIIEMLIDAEADVMLQDDNGYTALTLAEYTNDYNENIIKLLTDEKMFRINSHNVKG